jgi:hypothetical protein
MGACILPFIGKRIIILYVMLLITALFVGERLGTKLAEFISVQIISGGIQAFLGIFLVGLLSIWAGAKFENHFLKRSCGIEYWYPPISLGFFSGVLGSIIWTLG